MFRTVRNEDTRLSGVTRYFPKGNMTNIESLPELLKRAQEYENSAQYKYKKSQQAIYKITEDTRQLECNISDIKYKAGPIISKVLDFKYQQSIEPYENELSFNHLSFDNEIKQLNEQYINICKEVFTLNFVSIYLPDLITIQREIVSISKKNLDNILNSNQAEEGKSTSKQVTKETLAESIMLQQAESKLSSLIYEYHQQKSFCKTLEKNLYQDNVNTIKSSSNDFFRQEDATNIKHELKKIILIKNLTIPPEENITQLYHLLNTPISNMINKVKQELEQVLEYTLDYIQKHVQLEDDLQKHQATLHEAALEINRERNTQRTLKYLIEKLDVEEKNPTNLAKEELLGSPSSVLKKRSHSWENQDSNTYNTDSTIDVNDDIDSANFLDLLKDNTELEDDLQKHYTPLSEATSEINRARNAQMTLKDLVEKLDVEEKNPTNLAEEDNLLPPKTPPLKKPKTQMVTPQYIGKYDKTLLCLTDEEKIADVTFAGATPPRDPYYLLSFETDRDTTIDNDNDESSNVKVRSKFFHGTSYTSEVNLTEELLKPHSSVPKERSYSSEKQDSNAYNTYYTDDLNYEVHSANDRPLVGRLEDNTDNF